MEINEKRKTFWNLLLATNPQNKCDSIIQQQSNGNFSLLLLPLDVLKHFIFTENKLDPFSLTICRHTCKRLYNIIPKISLKENIQTIAIRLGYCGILQWLRQVNLYNNKGVSALASKYKHYQVLQWQRSNGLKIEYGGTPWFHIAKRGQIEILQAAYDAGFDIKHSASRGAAKGGHLNILQWLKSIRCQLTKDHYTFAAKAGNINIMEYLHSYEITPPIEAYESAAKHGHLDVFNWLCERTALPDNNITYKISVILIKNGYLHVLKWFRHIRILRIVDITNFISYVVMYGHLHILQWLQEIIDQHTLHYRLFAYQKIMVQYRHLHILKWIHSLDIPIQESVYQNSLKEKNMEIVEWYREINNI